MLGLADKEDADRSITKRKINQQAFRTEQGLEKGLLIHVPSWMLVGFPFIVMFLVVPGPIVIASRCGRSSPRRPMAISNAEANSEEWRGQRRESSRAKPRS